MRNKSNNSSIHKVILGPSSLWDTSIDEAAITFSSNAFSTQKIFRSPLSMVFFLDGLNYYRLRNAVRVVFNLEGNK